MAEAQSAPKVWTVSELTADLKALLESKYPQIDLEGEISGFRHYSSGHCYFTLKDAGAQISAVLFKWQLEACVRGGLIAADALKDGAKVKVRGKLSVYAERGNYQLTVKLVRLVGEGELMQRYLALKARLAAEGLFDAARKRPLPSLPRRIAIVTSDSGAVIHDMVTVMTRRFPDVQIRLYPSLVQGAEAPKTLIAGIAYFNALTDWIPDVLIVARGGGSFEDLFCFNDEALVRALAASRIPTISAVGHESDFTLCDFVADLRAGTPSIAAERAIPVRAELEARLAGCRGRLAAALRARGEWCSQRVDQLSEALAAILAHRAEVLGRRLDVARTRLAPALGLAAAAGEKRCLMLSGRLEPAVRMAFVAREARLDKVRARLDLLSPYSVLERGYSLTTAEDGSVVKDASCLQPGQRISTRLAKGAFVSTVDRVA